MTKIYKWHDHEAEQKIIAALNQGAVVAGSSDTVIGLLAPFTAHGYRALNQIKQRSKMPFLVLVKNSDQAMELAHMSQRVESLAKEFWPGPLTLILPATQLAPNFAQSPTGGIALRMPRHAGLQAVLAQTGPLFSTSANLSGKPIAQTINEIDPKIKEQVALLVSDVEEREGTPSTILDCTGGQIKLIREGAISKQRLQKYLK